MVLRNRIWPASPRLIRRSRPLLGYKYTFYFYCNASFLKDLSFYYGDMLFFFISVVPFPKLLMLTD